MKKTFFTVLLVSLSFNSYSSDESVMVRDKAIRNAMFQNAKILLCENSQYSSCYGVTSSECKREVEAVQEICFHKAKNVVGIIDSSDKARQFGEFLGGCIQKEQILKHHFDDASKVAVCLNGVQF
ncbi:hypothetical protein ACJJI4_12210 [Microbulbifer sp. TRSA002]|uniref:hypothetical protein n=1 Tax=Microbulbifer sp. TRSA002 TaxID=3243382 RepID=UPI00403A24DA